MASEQDIGISLEQLSKIASQSDEARSQVLDALQNLQLRLEAPEDLNLRLLNLQLQLTATQIGQDLNLFQILQKSAQPLTVDGLSHETGAETPFLRKPSQTESSTHASAETLIGRFLRYLASMNQIGEISQDTFAANNTTNTLAQPAYRGFVYHHVHTVGAVSHVFPDVLAATNYRNLEEATDTATKKAFSTDQTGFEWLRAQPRRFEAFQQAMSLAPQARVPWFTVFPLAAELERRASPGNSNVDSVALVDVGGGFGQRCAALVTAFPALRGRLVLQDVPQTLAIAPPLDGVRAMEHDFFAPQPSGARGSTTCATCSTTGRMTGPWLFSRGSARRWGRARRC
ncbi:hypothetical protein Daus18300_010145 [Diaporthe australafricana]|uniref:O-methyltransferase domain-containing protein n=1 Tax=Diaporthe australafricana TaxID=127596 RepID=A0ABR3WBB9_9PEZI